MAFLTDRTLATGITSYDLIHIVITGDTSQNPAGSSYKATMGQVLDLINPTTLTGGTYDSVTGSITFFDDTGGSFTITGLVTGFSDTFVTAFTYNNANTFTITENDGSSFSSSINVVTGMTFNGFCRTSGSTASGIYSFAIGQGTQSLGNYSHSEGLGTITSGDYQHVQGQYNLTASTQSAFIIGNGSSDLNRSNLVLAAGNSFNVYGDLLVTGNTTLSATTASTLNISSTPLTDSGITTYYLTRDSSNGDVKTKVIPGPTVYGLFNQTGNSIGVSATTVEGTIINGGIGTLSVPANGFSVGESFRGEFGGVLSAKNNDTLRIRVKAGLITLADSGPQAIPASTNNVFELGVNFTIRKVGVAGVAEIVTLGVFSSIKQANGTPIGFAFNTVNNTTFDTTISNTLDVTAEWSTNSVLNSIYSDIFILNKIF